MYANEAEKRYPEVYTMFERMIPEDLIQWWGY